MLSDQQMFYLFFIFCNYDLQQFWKARENNVLLQIRLRSRKHLFLNCAWRQTIYFVVSFGVVFGKKMLWQLQLKIPAMGTKHKKTWVLETPMSLATNKSVPLVNDRQHELNQIDVDTSQFNNFNKRMLLYSSNTINIMPKFGKHKKKMTNSRTVLIIDLMIPTWVQYVDVTLVQDRTIRFRERV